MKFPVFDLHCDTIWKISEEQENGNRVSLLSNSLAVDQNKLLNGNFFATCFAIFFSFVVMTSNTTETTIIPATPRNTGR